MTKTTPKSDGAFRTIREVADWLGVPTHVLRFWESKFDQIAPVKGAGGRRYYRPEDMRLLGGIKVMLHDKGLTIRGVTRVIEEEGLDPLMALSPPLESEAAANRTRRVIRSGEEDRRGADVVPLVAPRTGAGPGGGDAPSPDRSEPLPDGSPEGPAVDPEPLPDGAPNAPDRPRPAGPDTGPANAPGPVSPPQEAPTDDPDLLPGQPEDSADAPDTDADTAHDRDPSEPAPSAPEPAGPVRATETEDGADVMARVAALVDGPDAPSPEAIPAGDDGPSRAARACALLRRSEPRQASRLPLRRLRRRLRSIADEIRDDLEHGAAR